MKKTLALCVGSLLVSSIVGAAVPLLPATTVDNPLLGVNATPDFTVGMPANFGSYVLVNTLVSPYVGGFAGAVTTSIWKDTDNSLTFGYQFNNTTGGPVVDIVRATIGDPTQPWFGYVISDTGSDASGSSTLGGGGTSWIDGNPNFILRDPVISGAGLTIQWRDTGDGTVIRNPGDTSALVWFDTDALSYQSTDVGILDSGVVSTANAYAPASTYIPEPTSLALFGLLGLGLLRRRR